MKTNIDDLQKEYEKNPNVVENIYNLGVYFLEANNPKKAIEYFEKALNINSDLMADINFGLAQSYKEIDKIKGEKHLDIALKLKPELEGNFYMGDRKYY